MIGLDRQVLPVAVGLDRKNYLGAILREGVVDLQSVIAALMEMKYLGFLSIEHEGVGDPELAWRRGVAGVRELVAMLTGARQPVQGEC